MKTKKLTLKQRVENLEFLNPRRLATLHNWPAGSETVRRDFGVLVDDRGRERAVSWTTGQPKQTASWYDWVRIVDGSDDRTYVVCYSGDQRTEPVDNQGRAVIYAGSLAAECAVYESGPMFRQIQAMRNSTAKSVN